MRLASLAPEDSAENLPKMELCSNSAEVALERVDTILTAEHVNLIWTAL
jgi:hypothetical protein